VGVTGSRQLPSPAWIANDFLARMPVFPTARWTDLLEMREHLRLGRRRLWTAMQELALKLEDDTPAGIIEAAVEWQDEVSAKLEEIDELLNQAKGPRWWRNFIADGGATAFIGVGIAVANVASDHPLVAAAEGLGISTAHSCSATPKARQ